MTLRVEPITLILLGVTILLLITDIWVTPVLTERCVQETGKTCAEAIHGD